MNMHWKQKVSALLAGILLAGCLPIQAAALDTAAGVAMTQEKVDAANAAYDQADAALEIISMSDTHIASYESKKWAFESIADWSESIGFEADVVMVDGDVEANERLEFENSSTVFYNAVIQLFGETFPQETAVLFAYGNHDRKDYMIPMLQAAKAAHPNWYFEQNSGTNCNYHVQVGGFDFITLDYTNYRSFLRSTLSAITSAADYDAGKPIFVQVHSGLNGTTWGGDQDIAGSAIQSELAAFPQAIVMTAHSHYSNEVESGIWQGKFTVVNNGSMDYVELPSGLEPALPSAQGKFVDGAREHLELTCNYISVLTTGETVIRRYDVTNQRWMGMPWIIETANGAAGFRYTDARRSSVAPWFEADAEILVSDVDTSTATLQFTQAVDDELVQNYEITIKEVIGNKNASFTVLPDLVDPSGAKSYSGTFTAYSRFYLRPYPEQMKLYLSELSPATSYRVLIRAVDDFGNASATQEFTFKTTGQVEDLPTTLPENIRDGMVLDMQFEQDLTDAQKPSWQATSYGTITYEEGRTDASAVRVPSGASHYIDLVGRGDLNFGTSQDATISFWVKPYQVGYDDEFLSNKNWTSGKNAGFTFYASSMGVLNFQVGSGVSKRLDTGVTGLPTESGQWSMVTVVLDRANATCKTYLNGRLQKTVENVPADVTMTGPYSIKIGRDGGNYAEGNQADFAMDDLQMWSRALADTDVLALYGVDNNIPDDTDYRALLDQALAAAKQLRELALSGRDGVYTVTFDATWIARLAAQIEEAEAAADSATNDQLQEFTSELQYLTEQAEASKQLTLDPPRTLPDGVWDGLQVHLPFENDLTDLAGQATASTTAELSYGAGVREGSAVHLQKNQRVDLGAIASLDELGTTGDATYSFWYKAYAITADQVIFGNKSWSSATNAGFVLAYDYNDGDPTHISGSIGPGNGSYAQTSYLRLRDLVRDDWNMLLVTVDRTAGTFTTYVNGIVYTSGPLHENATLTSGLSYYIGGSNLDFAMDNLRIWNRALSDMEIVSIYGVDLLGEQPPDTTAPVLTVPADSSVMQGSAFDPMDGVSAADDTDGDLTDKIQLSGVVDTAVAGAYTLTYTVSDRAGNEATATRTVTVEAADDGGDGDGDNGGSGGDNGDGDGDGDNGGSGDSGGGSGNGGNGGSSGGGILGPNVPEQAIPEQDIPGQAEPTPSASSFSDVPEGAYYADALTWAVENGIATGISRTLFAPDAPCTRAQSVTFLWRAMGSPEPTTTVNPFSDVSETHYAYKAILWAAENGITTGTGNGRFSPDETCNRAQVVTFLHRAAQKPTAAKANAFTDVPQDAYYAGAVQWAVDEGITAGTGETTFGPEEDCTRAQIVAFLFRQFGP